MFLSFVYVSLLRIFLLLYTQASLKAIASDSTSTSGDKDNFTNDDYSRVKGPEKRGYVRLVGRMPSVKKSGDSSTDAQTIQQLTSVVNVMFHIIQEHIPNANISEVLNNMNIEVLIYYLFVLLLLCIYVLTFVFVKLFQVPGISSVPNNSHSVNQRSPSRSGTNNGNYFYVSNFVYVVIGKIDYQLIFYYLHLKYLNSFSLKGFYFLNR